jgi:signal transduction histidine kinase
MMHRGNGFGVLLAFDRGPEQAPFTATDETLLRTFAASAAAAVATSRSVEADRLRSTIAAAEAERRRWARELHDETLQALGGLRVLLSGAMRRDDPEDTKTTVTQAISDIETEIANLRAIITELRPMLLDDLGLGPAIDALVERRSADGLEITTDLVLSDIGGEQYLSPEAETTIYRLIQETLTNIVKHAKASHVTVTVQVSNRRAVIRVSDDGVGFDPEASASGFGLDGIRERIYLANGTLTITSAPGTGTTVHASLPLSGREYLRDEAVPDGRLAHGLG